MSGYSTSCCLQSAPTTTVSISRSICSWYIVSKNNWRGMCMNNELERLSKPPSHHVSNWWSQPCSHYHLQVPCFTPINQMEATLRMCECHGLALLLSFFLLRSSIMRVRGAQSAQEHAQEFLSTSICHIQWGPHGPHGPLTSHHFCVINVFYLSFLFPGFSTSAYVLYLCTWFLNYFCTEESMYLSLLAMELSWTNLMTYQ